MLAPLFAVVALIDRIFNTIGPRRAPLMGYTNDYLGTMDRQIFVICYFGC